MVISSRSRSKRVELLRTTWFSAIPSNAHSVCVVGGASSDFLRGDVLNLNAPDDYLGLPLKMATMFAFVARNFDFDYLVKCDDDMFLDIRSICNLLAESKALDYVGRVVRRHDYTPTHHWGKATVAEDNPVTNSEWQGPYCGGGVYILSKKAVLVLAESMLEAINDDLYEDKLVGDVLRRQHIGPKELDHRLKWGTGGGWKPTSRNPILRALWRAAFVHDFYRSRQLAAHDVDEITHKILHNSALQSIRLCLPFNIIPIAIKLAALKQKILD
jgi:hypothetical protein